MAKMNPMFSYHGTYNNVTEVHSKLYGRHMRKARGTNKPALLNEAFQKSVSLNQLANPVAKVVKDALDPFREGFQDGSMWGRLVGLFKKHFRQNVNLDLSILEDFELYDKIYLSTHYHVETAVSILRGREPSLSIELASGCSLSLEKYGVDSYAQTLIVVFLDTDLRATTRSELVRVPLKKTDHKQLLQWPIPLETKWALIVVKCEPYRDGEPIGRVKTKGMSVVKVCEV